MRLDLGDKGGDDMTSQFKKVAAGIAAGALFFSSLTPMAFAEYGSMNHADQQAVTSDNSWGNSWFHSHRLFTVLRGSEEVPGPGDPNGFGFVRLNINPDQGQVCIRMRVFQVATSTAAHIHKGAEGVAGPVVVTLPTPDTNGRANACVSANTDVAKDIVNNPSDYYVNVHNADYPSGAARGQL